MELHSLGAVDSSAGAGSSSLGAVGSSAGANDCIPFTLFVRGNELLNVPIFLLI